MILRKNNSKYEVDDYRVLEGFVHSPLFNDRSKGGRLKLSLFISMPEPLGLGCTIPDMKELLKVEDLWKQQGRFYG